MRNVVTAAPRLTTANFAPARAPAPFHPAPTVSVSCLSRVPPVPRVPLRAMSATTRREDPFKPAARVAGQKQDVWSIVNEAAAASPIKPIVNMG